MLSTSYLRCSQAPQIRLVLARKGSSLAVSCQTRTALQRGIAARPPVSFIPVRHFFRDKITEGVSFKPNHVKDGIPETFRLIYYNGSIRYYMYGIPGIYAVVTASFILIGLILSKKFIDKESWDRNHAQAFRGRYTVEDPIVFVIMGVPFLLLILMGTLTMSKGIVMRIYHEASTGRYIARTLNFGILRQTTKFTQEDIQLQTKKVNYFISGNVLVKDKTFIIIEKYFKSLGDFNRFMGYDIQKSSEHQAVLERENVSKIITRGFEHYQNEKDRSFEQKYMEKRKMRNSR